ncbi:arylacetamide deacetylase-like 4 [Halichoeres trimaculatus]|uniref:arylacetamide deacetylase-like 4 n=1 Tax=Halichoeres trimaculatus TaxID=147232 RepID=UPI003D9F702C
MKPEPNILSPLPPSHPLRYQLAPEHRYPAQLDDCETVTCHFLSVAEAGFNADSRRELVGGDRTGPNLAAVLCQRLARRVERHLLFPCAQVLTHPALQKADFNLPSYQQNHAVPILFCCRMVFCFLQYLNGDISVCQDVLESHRVPTELRPCYERLLYPSNLLPGCLTRGYSEHQTPECDGEVYTIKAASEH